MHHGMQKGLGKEAGRQGESRPCGRARHRRGGFVAKEATGRTRRKWRGAPFQNPQYWGRQANWAGGARCLDAAPNAARLGASLGRGEDRRLARPFERTGETGVDGKTRTRDRRACSRGFEATLGCRRRADVQDVVGERFGVVHLAVSMMRVGLEKAGAARESRASPFAPFISNPAASLA